MRPDVVVVGGGVIGCSIAESLSVEGVRVRVLERGDVGAEASGAAAGMLAPIAEARGDDPLLRMGLESLERFPALCTRLEDEVGIDPELESSGELHLVTDAVAREALAARFDALPGGLRSGAQPVWRDREELSSDLVGYAPDVAGAFETSFAKHLRPPLLVRALESAARRKGVEIATGVSVHALCVSGDRVVGVETNTGRLEADAVVVAAGPWTPSLLERAVPDTIRAGGVAIEPVRGQILSLAPPLPTMRKILWHDALYLVPKRDGHWVVGATEERVGFDRRVTADGVATLVGHAKRILPSLGEARFDRAWAGLRPVSADGVPWIGAFAERSGLFVAAGHGRNGILLSPLTAERVRDAVLGKRVGADDPCRVDRVFDVPRR